MLTLIREGGIPMWFILLLGLVSLAGGASFAARPNPGRERFVQNLGVAIFFATLVGVFSAFGATFHYVGDREMDHARRVQLTLVGLGESMAPLILGFGVLTVLMLLVAVGRARLDARREE